MRRKIGSSTRIMTVLVILFSLVCLAGMVACGSSNYKTVESGATWTVAQKTTLNGTLTIEDGAVVNAPDGYLLTMTVGGVETAIAPGTYTGDVVLTPTKKISKALYNGKMTQGANIDYRTGLFVDAGHIVQDSSVTSALVGGTYDDTSASGMTITSNNSLFDGIIINDSNYTVSNVTMTANGAGGNDFTGYGAGIAVTGASNVVIDNFNFTGVGPLRHAIYSGGEFEKDNLTVTVKNSFLKTDGSVGEAPPGAGMSSVPWMLGIETYGHVRTQMIDGYANVRYENTTLLSDGWGILSTDDVSAPQKFGDFSIKLYVKDSNVDITGTSGYGSYAIGACHNVFENTVMGNTKYSSTKYGLTYALICANEYAGGEFINGTHVTAKYGVMYHKNQTGITKVDGAIFDTHGANFLIKHCYPVITVNNSELNSDTGVILQLMSSDDPGMGKSYYTELLDPSAVVKDENHDIYHVTKTDTKIFTTELKDVVSDAQGSFSNMKINGDFYNSVSGVDDDDLHLKGQNLVLSFDNVKLTGVVSSATAVHRNYSFYFAEEKDADGNKIAVNGDGYQIDGKWEAQKGMGGGGMPGGMSGAPAGAEGGRGDMSGAPGAAEGGRGGAPAAGGMPSGGPSGGAMQGAPAGGPGGGMPEGGAPGGAMAGGPGGGSSTVFTPATDDGGNYIVTGDKKYDLYEGVIVSKNATYLGDLINTPAPAVNNGMIVTLSGDTVWTVTGTSYLTSLTLDGGQVTAPEGSKVEMTVNGKKTKIENGKTYTGDIVISLAK